MSQTLQLDELKSLLPRVFPHITTADEMSAILSHFQHTTVIQGDSTIITIHRVLSWFIHATEEERKVFLKKVDNLVLNLETQNQTVEPN